MKTLLIDNGSKYFEDLKHLLDIYPDNEVTPVSYPEIPSQNLTDFNLVVLSGGNNKDANHEEANIILNNHIPVLGICLGFGLISKTFGGQFRLLDQKEHGLIEITSVCDDPIFQGVTNPVQVYESHKYSVINLPPVLIELAKSSDGPEIIKHVSKPIYGFQFHPELNPENQNTFRLFTNTLTQLCKK